MVIICTIHVCDRMTNVLFDLGSTYSYVFVRFASNIEMLCDVIDTLIRVSIPIGESVLFTHVYRACHILFMGFQTLIDFTDFVYG